jgi:hypothetical protein
MRSTPVTYLATLSAPLNTRAFTVSNDGGRLRVGPEDKCQGQLGGQHPGWVALQDRKL